MKDVIDVMELQREKQRRAAPPLDYRQLDFNGGFTPARFVFECGIKLNAQPLTLATAAVLMHRFFKEVDQNNYDCFVSSFCFGSRDFLGLQVDCGVDIWRRREERSGSKR